MWVVLVGFWWLGAAVAALAHGEIAAGTAAILLVSGPRLFPALGALPGWWRVFRGVVFVCGVLVWVLQRWWAIPETAVIPLAVTLVGAAVVRLVWGAVVQPGHAPAAPSVTPPPRPAPRPPTLSAPERVGTALGYGLLAVAFLFGAGMAHSELADQEQQETVADLIADTQDAIRDGIAQPQ